MQPDWSIYEDAARAAIMSLRRELGLVSVGGKAKAAGNSGATWELDARAWQDESGRFLLVEARRYRRSRLKQEDIAAVAFRVHDLGANGAIVVSPLPMQEGAKLVASHAHIEHIQLTAESTPELYLAEYMGQRYHGVAITDSLSVSATLVGGCLGPPSDA